MKRLIAAALAIGVLGGLASARQQGGYLTPEQLKVIEKMPAMDESKRVNIDDIDKLLADGKVLFLDVREPKEIEDLGTRKDYMNIPIGQLEKRMNELPKDRAILTA